MKSIADQVYHALKVKGPMTSEEISEYLKMELAKVSGCVGSLISRKTNPLYRTQIKAKTSNRKLWVYSITVFKNHLPNAATVEKAPAAVEEVPLRTEPVTPVQIVNSSQLMETIQSVGVQIAQLICTAVIENLTPIVQKRVGELVTALVPQQPIEVPQQVVKTKLRKIAVIGLTPIQQQEITSEFKKDFSIQYWQSGENTSLLKSISAHAECVFVHVNHISHSAEDTLKSIKANIVRVPGGVGTMKDAITKYFCETT